MTPPGASTGTTAPCVPSFFGSNAAIGSASVKSRSSSVWSSPSGSSPTPLPSAMATILAFLP